MSSIMKHGWLVLFFLLAIHTNLTGCTKSAIILDDDDIAVHHDIDVPFDDDEDDDHATAAATRKIKANNQSVTFLRKNTLNRKDTAKGKDIFHKACSKAIGGGVPGAVAGVIQVLSLMWLVSIFMSYDMSSLHNLFNSTFCVILLLQIIHLMMQKTFTFQFPCYTLNLKQRTVINYQYRYGSTFLQALTTLYGIGKSTIISSLPFA